jgi:hypothetical protein
MKYAIYSEPKPADQLREIRAKMCGYPIYGRDIGGGVHTPREQSATRFEYDVRVHPEGKLWAYPLADDAKAATSAAVTASAAKGDTKADEATAITAAIAAIAELDKSWDANANALEGGATEVGG